MRSKKRLIARHQRAKDSPPVPPWVILKDYFPLVIAIGSLIVSGLVAYKTSIYKAISVSVAVGDEKVGFGPRVRKEGTWIWGSATMTFVNEGNRPVAIQGFEYNITLIEGTADTRDQCFNKPTKGAAGLQSESFVPFVLQGGDIQIRPVRFGTKMQRTRLVSEEDIEGKGAISIYICSWMTVDLVADGLVIKKPVVDLSLIRLYVSEGGLGVGRVLESPANYLTRLIDERRFY